MYEYIFKLVIIGNNNVGKSSIVRAFTDLYFNHQYHSTIGIDFSSKIVQLEKYNNIPIKLQIWDTAGAERFKSIVRNYYRNCIGIIITFDITNMDSFNNVQGWYDDLINFTNRNITELSIVLVGNKNDLEAKRSVSMEEIRKLSNFLQCTYIETSAKCNTNIQELFYLISNEIYHKIENHQILIDDSIKIKMNKLEIDERQPKSRLAIFTNCCVIS